MARQRYLNVYTVEVFRSQRDPARRTVRVRRGTINTLRDSLSPDVLRLFEVSALDLPTATKLGRRFSQVRGDRSPGRERRRAPLHQHRHP